MLNVVALMGRLTADPELRHTPNGVAVTTFSIAVNRSYVKQGAERQTDFLDIVAWRSTAEFVCKYFKKGSQVAVSGSIQTRSYEEKDTGKKRKVFEIVADNVYFAEGRAAQNSGGNASFSNAGTLPAADNAPMSFENTDEDSDFSFVAGDDDLPF